VADPGQGVVLADDPHGGAWPRSGAFITVDVAHECRFEAVSTSLDGEPRILEGSGDQVGSEAFLEHELGIGVNLMGQVDQHRGTPIDLGNYAGLGRTQIRGHDAEFVNEP